MPAGIASTLQMSNFDKLKKKAAEFETRNQPELALEMYEEILNNTRSGEEGRDIPLYNRVGDLHLSVGNNEQAVDYYEKAADLYASSGSLNNAIALCNKILRFAPDQTTIYYKLGIISAKKGFNSDAKQNFLEYADRMQRLGETDEAFRALKEFADLCPEQDDVRLLLAEQLVRAGRGYEALRQLQFLHGALEAQGRTTEALATLDRMRAIDPEFLPATSAIPPQPKRDGLGFLDLDLDAAPSNVGTPDSLESAEPVSAEATEPPVTAGLGDEAESPAVAGIELAPPSDSGRAGDMPSAIGLEAGDIDDAVDLLGSDHREQTAAPRGHSNEDAYVAAPGEEFAAASVDGAAAGAADQPPSGAADRAEQAEEAEKADEAEQAEEADKAGGAPVSPPDDDYVDLGEWLERTRTPVSTRMVAHDEVPEDNAQKEFGEMLAKFKEGVSRNVDEGDFESHYDLGIAFKEMGLLDEAIGSFQKAARGPGLRVRAAESMGECFLDKNEPGVAMAVLEQLGHDPTISDTQLVGVLYLLGRSAEALGRPRQATGFYRRVLAVHIGFRDTQDRLSSLTPASL
ncbi:MAG: hypothetical protein ACR2G6_06575 [Gemmatimonadaceae bacterium]